VTDVAADHVGLELDAVLDHVSPAVWRPPVLVLGNERTNGRRLLASVGAASVDGLFVRLVDVLVGWINGHF